MQTEEGREVMLAGTRLSRSVAALLAGAALFSAAPVLAKDVGIASAVANDVRLKNPGDAQAHAARVREPIALAEQVSTGPASRLQMLLLDKSTFSVGANARLTIDRFIYDADQKSNFTATLAKGAFRFLSGSRGHGATTAIKTPVATIGIRGTMVDGIVGAEAIELAQREQSVGRIANADPETATLVVLRGPGAGTLGAGTGGNVTPGAISVEAGGKVVATDRPAMAVFVPFPGAQPIGPFPLSSAGLRQIEGMILPAANPVLTSGQMPTYERPERRALPGGIVPVIPIGNLGGDDRPASRPNAPGGSLFNNLPTRTGGGNQSAPQQTNSSGTGNQPTDQPPTQAPPPAQTTTSPPPSTTGSPNQTPPPATTDQSPPPPPPPTTYCSPGKVC